MKKIIGSLSFIVFSLAACSNDSNPKPTYVPPTTVKTMSDEEKQNVEAVDLNKSFDALFAEMEKSLKFNLIIGESVDENGHMTTEAKNKMITAMPKICVDTGAIYNTRSDYIAVQKSMNGKDEMPLTNAKQIGNLFGAVWDVCDQPAMKRITKTYLSD